MDVNLSLTGIILAAGKGKRMKSSLPKVLHKIAGKPMLEHVLLTLQATPLDNFCVVLNDDLEPFAEFRAAYPDLTICVQKVQNGTGGAVAACAAALKGVDLCPYAPGERIAGEALNSSHLLVCLGDSPALQAAVVEGFIADSLRHKAPLAVLGMEVDNPKGYGRLVLGEGQEVRKIIEDKDASPEQQAIRICNSGVIFGETQHLFSLLQRLEPQNAQSEFYLTDCIELSYAAGKPARVYLSQDWQSFLGVNTPEQLQALERYMNAQR